MLLCSRRYVGPKKNEKSVGELCGIISIHMPYKFTDIDRRKSVARAREKAAKNKLREGTHPSGRLLRTLLLEVEKREYKCECCGIDTWQGRKLTLQIDHINGIHYDNRPENLRFICPNCHSLTDTFCGAGNTGTHKVLDNELINAIVTTKNVRQALIKVGLTPKGANYQRVMDLVTKFELKFNDAPLAELVDAADFEERVKAQNGANPESSS